MQECRWFRKKSICSVALQLRRCGAPISAPHSSVFARLASGAFYETIVSVTFYEITIIEFRDLAIRHDFTSFRHGEGRKKCTSSNFFALHILNANLYNQTKFFAERGIHCPNL